jgi:prolyl-tRNA editing enzyme YbaK/EbsC (Cys-tRNA(Pro) deacylase)
VLVIASGPDRIDEQRLADVIGEPVAKALIEERLLSFDPIWAAAGTPHHVFPVSPDELRRVTGGEVVALARIS